VTRRVEGTSRIYQLADPTVLAGYHALVAVAQARIAEVSALADASFGPVVGARAVTLDEFEAVAGDPHVVLVDVRPASEFAAGHVAGAVNIPVSELATRMSELPPDARIVAYCRGPYCVMAATAVARLRDAGYDAARLAGGYPDWALARRPVE